MDKQNNFLHHALSFHILHTPHLRNLVLNWLLTKAVILEILHALELPERHLKTQIAGPHQAQEFGSIILDWGLSICISDNFSSDADVASWSDGWGIHFENQLT